MPLNLRTRSFIIPKNNAEWDRLFRSIEVETDDDTVSTDSIQDNAVTNTKLRNSSALSVIGRAANSSGDPGDISAGSDNQFLARRVGTLVFAGLVDADIPLTIARDTEVTAAVAAHEGLSDPHPGYALESTATFTGTLTGCTTSPTATLRYTKVGNQVTLYIPQLNATSNTAACTITGAPAAIQPARAQTVLARVQDNSAVSIGGITVETSGTLTLAVGVSLGAFTSANTKGVELQTITYSLD